jgi:hypothetical protein
MRCNNLLARIANLAFDVQLLAEDLCSRFDGKFLLLGTGQNALTDTPNLQKLMARFRVPIQLTNTDIQTVIRKTILDKKPTAIAPLNTNWMHHQVKFPQSGRHCLWLSN